MLKIFLTGLFFFINYSFVHSQERRDEYADMEKAFNKGYELLYVHKDSSYYYFGEALDLAVSINDHESQLDILGLFIYANGYHYDLDRYYLNLQHVEKIVFDKALKDSIDQYDYYLNSFLLDKGNYYFKTKEYEKAKPVFLELQTLYEKVPINALSVDEAAGLFSVYNFLATIYKHTGKYYLSEQYYLKNRSLVENSTALIDKRDSYLTNINQLLAQLYNLMGNYSEANHMLSQAVKTYRLHYQEDKKFKNTLVTSVQKLAANYIQQDSLLKALTLLNESQDYLLPEDPFYKESLLLYGDIYLAQGKPLKTVESYNEALKSFKKYRQNRPHQDVAMAYGKMAQSYLAQGKYDDGMQHLIQAFNNAGPDIQIRSIQKNPKPQNVFSKRQLLYLLDLKLQLLQSAYSSTKNGAYLNALMETNRSILTTFDLLKKEFESKLDKEFLAETVYPIFHRMLSVAHTAYELQPSLELLTLALNIAEKNKDFLLLEALRNTRATSYGNVPEAVLGKEAQLRAEITQLEKNIFDASDKDSRFSGLLLQRKEAYYTFLDSLKLTYPKYHDLKYQTENINLTTIRSQLIENQDVLISFTMTDKDLYAIVLDRSKENFIKLRFDESDQKEVREFYKLISRPTIKTTEKNIVLARRIYDKVLRKTLQGFEGQNLTIVPDGVLHYLPFDLLQKDEDYLVHSKIISYANSVASLLELKKRKASAAKGLLAFAPSFDEATPKNSERKFGKLLYNISEVNAISAIFDTHVFKQANGTLQNFMEAGPNFRNIHLATHASANDEFPDFSYLAFSENGKNAHTLYIKDLYNTSLNADMVTLSACQTGIGRLQQGQGMMSLSKGFYYAGAKSLVSSLWKVNDKSTVKLMEYFYKALSEGKSKAEALRFAKLAYLKTTEDNLLKHPYYWSAFVVSGNVDPINDSVSPWWWLLVAIPLVVAPAYYMKRKKSV